MPCSLAMPSASFQVFDFSSGALPEWSSVHDTVLADDLIRVKANYERTKRQASLTISSDANCPVARVLQQSLIQVRMVSCWLNDDTHYCRRWNRMEAMRWRHRHHLPSDRYITHPHILLLNLLLRLRCRMAGVWWIWVSLMDGVPLVWSTGLLSSAG